MTVAIPHPNGQMVRIIVPPHSPSMPSLTSDEALLMAQHAEIERLRAEASMLRTALAPLANAHFSHERAEISADDCVHARWALYGHNIKLTGGTPSG